MDLIQRPKKTARQDKGYMTNEQYQDYTREQFQVIYDKIDELCQAPQYEDGSGVAY